MRIKETSLVTVLIIPALCFAVPRHTDRNFITLAGKGGMTDKVVFIGI